MKDAKALLAGLLLIVGLALIVLPGHQPDPEREWLRTAQLRADLLARQARREALEPWARAFCIALGLVGLGSVAGLSIVLVLAIYRRLAATVPPNRSGLFPIVRLGRTLHDPNRQPTGTVTYTRGAPRFPQLPGQAETTARAQFVQATAARYREGQTVITAPHDPHPASRLLSAPLPEPEMSALEPSHVERLLLETGPQGEP